MATRKPIPMIFGNMGMESMLDTKDDSLFLSIQDSLTPVLQPAYDSPESIEMILLRNYEAMNRWKLNWQQFG